MNIMNLTFLILNVIEIDQSGTIFRRVNFKIIKLRVSSEKFICSTIMLQKNKNKKNELFSLL